MQDKINKWATSLTERIMEIRLLNVDELTVSISTHIKLALKDCLEDQLVKDKKLLLDKKFQLQNSTGTNNESIRRDYMKLKIQVEAEDGMRYKLLQDNKLRELTAFLKENHPDAYEQFQSTQIKDKN